MLRKIFFTIFTVILATGCATTSKFSKNMNVFERPCGNPKTMPEWVTKTQPGEISAVGESVYRKNSGNFDVSTARINGRLELKNSFYTTLKWIRHRELDQALKKTDFDKLFAESEGELPFAFAEETFYCKDKVYVKMTVRPEMFENSIFRQLSPLESIDARRKKSKSIINKFLQHFKRDS